MGKPQLVTPNVYRKKDRNIPLCKSKKGSLCLLFLGPRVIESDSWAIFLLRKIIFKPVLTFVFSNKI